MIPLAIPNISGNEGKYLQECIATNFVSTVGSFVTQFEERVAEAANARYGVSTCSGTAGLHLALTTLGVVHNDLVVLPSFTFIASANAISHCGASPWLMDVEPDSWTLDVQLLKDTLASETQASGDQRIHTSTGRRVAAVMTVYTLGQPSDMDPLREVAREFNLPLVADAAAALGCRYKGRNIGDLADLTVFSFNGNKTITAGGGGMVVGNDAELLRLVKHLSTTARVGTDYHHDRIGFNYRLTNIQAAVGCGQIERLDEFVANKRRLDAVYRQHFDGIEGIGLFPSPDWADSACWFTGITIDGDGLPSITESCERLQEKGVGARPFWKPIHLQPIYEQAPRTSMATCESIWKTILPLPCSTQLSAQEQQEVVNIVKQVLEQTV